MTNDPYSTPEHRVGAHTHPERPSTEREPLPGDPVLGEHETALLGTEPRTTTDSNADELQPGSTGVFNPRDAHPGEAPEVAVEGQAVATVSDYSASNQGSFVAEEGATAGPTHAGYGAGSPRFMVAGQHNDADGVVVVPGMLLVGERTVIGSGVGAQLQLSGIAAEHAVVHHTDDDEFVLVLYGPAETSGAPNTEINGEPGYILRTGFEVRLGEHSLVFQRDEYAHHGRPYGGREGGEFARQPQQVNTKSGPVDTAESYEFEREVE